MEELTVENVQAELIEHLRNMYEAERQCNINNAKDFETLLHAIQTKDNVIRSSRAVFERLRKRVREQDKEIKALKRTKPAQEEEEEPETEPETKEESKE